VTLGRLIYKERYLQLRGNDKMSSNVYFQQDINNNTYTFMNKFDIHYQIILYYRYPE